MRRFLIATAVTAFALAGLAVPASGAGSTCRTAEDATGADLHIVNGAAAYDANSTTEFPGIPLLERTTYSGGTLTLSLDVAENCRRASYAVTVLGTDGSALGGSSVTGDGKAPRLDMFPGGLTVPDSYGSDCVEFVATVTSTKGEVLDRVPDQGTAAVCDSQAPGGYWR